MSCYCDSYEAPEFFREKTVTARAEHTCCECRHKIQPGEQYQYVTGKWDGMFDTFHTCERCADLRDSLREIGCPAIGGLFEEYGEHMYDCEKAANIESKHRHYKEAA